MRLVFLAVLAAGLGLIAIGGAYGVGLMQYIEPRDSITTDITRCYYEVTGNSTMHHSMQYAITNNSTLNLSSAEIQTQLVRTDTEQDRIWVIDEGISISRLWPGQTLERTAEITTEHIDGVFECRVKVNNERFNLIQDVIALQNENKSLKTEISGLKAQISSMVDTISNISARLAELESGTTPKPPPDPSPSTGLAGRIYADYNNNGVLDPDEPGIPNMVLVIEYPAGVLLPGMVIQSDANGDYSINNLPPGEYRIGLRDFAKGLEPATYAVQQDQQTIANLPGPWWGAQGKVYLDNGNEIFDEGEQVISNHLLILRAYNENGVSTIRTTTDTNGDYSTRLPPIVNNYDQVEIWVGTWERIHFLIYDEPGVTTKNIRLTQWEPSQSTPHEQSATITGKVYWDRNGNGEVDGGEGIPNWVVAAQTHSISDGWTITDTNGNYALAVQPPYHTNNGWFPVFPSALPSVERGDRLMVTANMTVNQNISIGDPCNYEGWQWWIDRHCD